MAFEIKSVDPDVTGSTLFYYWCLIDADQMESASTSSQLHLALSLLNGIAFNVTSAPHVNAAHAMNMHAYAHGDITSRKDSASLN